MTTLLKHPHAEILVEDLPDGRRGVKVTLQNANLFMPMNSCKTTYPLDLIQVILDVKGPCYLCDEIAREEDAEYLKKDLENDLMAYFDRADFETKRILDFGCGSGASTMILSRMFPSSEIVGIELDEKFLSVAHARLKHYGFANVKLKLSMDGTRLPKDIGGFDFVILSAVYEHLLPNERRTVLPKIWAAIREHGFLFINMTPHRFFPIEHHTTGLPLINYLPAHLAMAAARRLSNRIDKREPWEVLLRRGIRGATEREILGILRQGATHQPVLLEPSQRGLHDRIDLWYSGLNRERRRALKLMLNATIRGIKAISGLTLLPNLSLVIQKAETPS